MDLLAAVVIGLIGLIITPGYLFYFDITPKTAVLLDSARRRFAQPKFVFEFMIIPLCVVAVSFF